MKPIIPNFTCLVKKMFPKYRPTIAMQAHVLLLALIVVKMVGWCTLCGFEYYKPNIAISDFFLPLEMIALQNFEICLGHVNGIYFEVICR